MRFCFSCQELIDGPAIVSNGNFYHPDHFCCDRCMQPIGMEFHAFKVWRLCPNCLPRPVCSSNHCSEPERRIGHGSGPYYRMPQDTRLEAFHGCHTARCSVCGRGLFCSASPADSLAYHLSEGRPTCTRCYYHVDQFNRWQRTPRKARDRSAHKGRKGGGVGGGGLAIFRPPLPDHFTAAREGPRKRRDRSASQSPSRGAEQKQQKRPATPQAKGHKAAKGSRKRPDRSASQSPSRGAKQKQQKRPATPRAKGHKAAKGSRKVGGKGDVAKTPTSPSPSEKRVRPPQRDDATGTEAIPSSAKSQSPSPSPAPVKSAPPSPSPASKKKSPAAKSTKATPASMKKAKGGGGGKGSGKKKK